MCVEFNFCFTLNMKKGCSSLISSTSTSSNANLRALFKILWHASVKNFFVTFSKNFLFYFSNVNANDIPVKRRERESTWWVLWVYFSFPKTIHHAEICQLKKCTVRLEPPFPGDIRTQQKPWKARPQREARWRNQLTRWGPLESPPQLGTQKEAFFCSSVGSCRASFQAALLM